MRKPLNLSSRFPPSNELWNAERSLPALQGVAFGVAVAIVSGAVAHFLIRRPDYTSDFYHYWSATRALLAGGDPYSSPISGALNPGRDPALYPLPAYLVTAPFALFPLGIAGGLFMAAGSGFAAWGVARTGMVRAPLFLIAPFLLSLPLGQWSPWLIAAALVPWLSWLVVAKPNVGLAVWLARPSWRTALAVAAILAVSLLVAPRWPWSWLSNLGGREEKFIPLLRPGGFLLVTALVAWRRPEGRLLAALSLVPQSLFFYDQLLLWLVPRTFRQSLLLSLWSFAAFLLWQRGLQPDDYYVQEAIPYAYSLYFAALVILLFNWRRDRTRRDTVSPSPEPDA